MSTKIAVICSADFFQSIQSVEPYVANIELIPYIYQEPQGAANLVKNIKPCDAVFFSGALPYYFSKKHRETLPIPTLYLVQDEMTITTSLLSIFYHKKVPLERISIDLIDSSFLTNVLESIDINVQRFHVMDYHQMLEKEEFDLKRITSYHYSLWKQGSVDLALTSIHAVFDQLQLLGVPALRMTDPISVLIRGLQDAKDQAELVKSQSAQVAVAYVSLNNWDNQQREIVDSFAHNINASVQQVDDALFVLYSTRGDIETLMKRDMLQHFLNKWEETITIGFGYGTTIMEADQNATDALRFAEKNAVEKCGYILTEKKELLGPFPQESKQLRLKNDHPEFLQIAKRTKLSPANLSKIMQFSKFRPSLQFTSKELAEYLQVTRRSTERIIKKLVDHGYARVVGEEMTYQQGRPRAIYELDLPTYF
ncbi:transcriptional regulator [Bacillus sp. FJAT-29790]|uniref:transcriptional regulator n=1 Tax=Bacillus sp. FJAT-29790 TaxID=1895002 RepID=UPI001C2254B0|nr:transcriptional regulator [Bacillus sp. FJAT-29790]MBU8880521.1 transcriptional regulator [Bacillus sp. FJAT-29790]